MSRLTDLAPCAIPSLRSPPAVSAAPAPDKPLLQPCTVRYGRFLWLAGSYTIACSWKGIQRFRRQGFPTCCCRAGSRVDLLIDGDTHSPAEIDWALKRLGSDGVSVQGRLFASPGRLSIKRWAAFIRERGLRFHSVKRTAGYKDPNDVAIIHQMQNAARRPAVDKIALLAADDDFLSIAQEIFSKGKEVTVLIPERKRGVIKTYADGGIRVVSVPTLSREGKPAAPLFYTVRAFLHPDGSGSICPSQPTKSVFMDDEVEEVRSFLHHLGFMQTSGSLLLTCMAKGWFVNEPRTLTIFPHQCAISELHRVISRKANSWKKPLNKLAYFFPLRRGGPKTQIARKEGSMAWKVAQSNGPFMMQDSACLPERALRKLGYVDKHLNKDKAEAMLVFANMNGNKRILRDTESLPDPSDTPDMVHDKLRRAFISNASSGNWQPPPKDADVVNLLVREGYLDGKPKSQHEKLRAMQCYSQRHDMPAMKTYLGFVWQLLRKINSTDPSRREVVGF